MSAEVLLVLCALSLLLVLGGSIAMLRYGIGGLRDLYIQFIDRK